MSNKFELINSGVSTLHVVAMGTTPLLVHALSEKAKRSLAGDTVPKTQKQETPQTQCLEALYAAPSDWRSDTALYVPPVWFKKAMCTAATSLKQRKELPAADVKRCITVATAAFDVGPPINAVPLYGIPRIHAAYAKEGSALRPRFRPILWPWAVAMTIDFLPMTFNGETVAALLKLGGTVSGVGDGRREKGWGDFGCYTVIDDMPLPIDKQAQLDAMADFEPWDEESAQIIEWATHG